MRRRGRDFGGYGVDTPSEAMYVAAASADGHRPRAGTVVVGAQPVAYDVLLAGTGGPARGVVRAAAWCGPRGRS